MSQLTREVVFGQTADATQPGDFLQAQAPQLARLSADGGSRRGGTVTSVQPDLEDAAPLLDGEQTQGGSFSVEEGERLSEGNVFERKVRLGVNMSWAVNIILFVSKVRLEQHPQCQASGRGKPFRMRP